MIGPRDNVFPGPAAALDGPDASCRFNTAKCNFSISCGSFIAGFVCWFAGSLVRDAGCDFMTFLFGWRGDVTVKFNIKAGVLIFFHS